jgi:hypothetical protein
MFAKKYEIVKNILDKLDGITDEDLENIKNADDEGIKKINLDLGKKIRNIYELWNFNNTNCFEYKTQKLMKHPSDFTIEILNEVREKLNEEEY